jgi:hypothetical protein
LRFEHPVRLAAPLARVDRGGALYLSDEPLPGFLAEKRGEFYALTPDEALIEAFAAWARPKVRWDGQCALLSRLSGGEAEDLPLLLAGIRLLDIAAPDSAIKAYEKRVRQRAAVCLRLKSGGGLLWLCLACAHLAWQANAGQEPAGAAGP